MRTMLAALILVAVPAQAEVVREMTPERVREAIAWGAARKDYPIYRLKAPFLQQRVASFATPFSRVAGAAFKAKQEYRTLEPEALPEDASEPLIHIYAVPHATQPTRYVPARVIGVRRVVITGPRGANPVEPVEVIPSVRTYGNAMGATWEANELVAKFPLDALRADAEVHVIYDDGDDVTYRFDLRDVR